MVVDDGEKEPWDDGDGYCCEWTVSRKTERKGAKTVYCTGEELGGEVADPACADDETTCCADDGA